MSSSYNFQRIRQDRLDRTQVNADSLNVSGSANIVDIAVSGNETVSGNVIISGNETVSGNVTVSGNLSNGAITTSSVTDTKSNSDISTVFTFTQPGGTYIKNLIISADDNIETLTQFTIRIGREAFTNILGEVNLLNNSTLTKDVPIYIISNGNGHPADGLKYTGGLTTSPEINLVSGGSYSATSSDDLRVSFVKVGTVSVANIKVIVEFQYL